MTSNLIRDSWTDLDSAEFRLLLDKHIKGPGQYDDPSSNPDKLYLPLAGSSCRIALTYQKKKIVTIERGQAFDASEWDRISEEIENSILAGPKKNRTRIQFQQLLHIGFVAGKALWRPDSSSTG